MSTQRYVHSWSGGKDSTASIILDHIHNDPPLAKTVIYAEVMFDLERDISGELPEHIEWINTVAIPRLESWGFKWGESFASVDRRVDQYLRAKELREGQIKLDV